MKRVLILDIETAPNIAYVWGAWKQNIGQNQWVSKSHIMSFAAKWFDEPEVYYEENRKSNDRKIVLSIYSFLDKADIVVAHHGRKFDIPTIFGRGVVHGLRPPSPFHIVDTREVASKEFRLVSNSLANLCQQFGLPQKSDHKKYPGFELWLGCLRNEEAAWQEMRDYNIADVISLEALYRRMLPYIKNHPNMHSNSEEAHCPKCNSSDIQWRGYYTSMAGLSYKKFCCNSCGGWGRVKTSEKEMNPVARNAK
jgi:hypothetical protein